MQAEMLHAAESAGKPEIFSSLQGEGIDAGTPAVFLRLAGCNLHCAWCDTKYARRGGIEIGVRAAAELIRAQSGSGHLVITGGEPLLQAAALESLLALIPCPRYVEVETNGTLFPPPGLLQCVDRWNVSPKLAHAHSGSCGGADVLPALAQLPGAWFKFVVRGEEDWAQVAASGVPHSRILLMPCAADRVTYRRLLPHVAEMCMRHGVRLSPRLHIELWDTQPRR